MSDTTHPLARDNEAVRLLEHTLIDIQILLDADRFALDGDEVVFTRRGRGGNADLSWSGRIGDWLVRDGQAFWRIVSDDHVVLPTSVPSKPGVAAT